MKKASGIGKEWNEQAAAFAKYVEGKTANEIAAIAVDESKHPGRGFDRFGDNVCRRPYRSRQKGD